MSSALQRAAANNLQLIITVMVMHVGHSTKSPEKLLELIVLGVAGEDQLIISCQAKYFAIHFQRNTFESRSNSCGSHLRKLLLAVV